MKIDTYLYVNFVILCNLTSFTLSTLSHKIVFVIILLSDITFPTNQIVEVVINLFSFQHLGS